MAKRHVIQLITSTTVPDITPEDMAAAITMDLNMLGVIVEKTLIEELPEQNDQILSGGGHTREAVHDHNLEVQR
jgi:hypothetical protein